MFGKHASVCIPDIKPGYPSPVGATLKGHSGSKTLLGQPGLSCKTVPSSTLEELILRAVLPGTSYTFYSSSESASQGTHLAPC